MVSNKSSFTEEIPRNFTFKNKAKITVIIFLKYACSRKY